MGTPVVKNLEEDEVCDGQLDHEDDAEGIMSLKAKASAMVTFDTETETYEAPDAADHFDLHPQRSRVLRASRGNQGPTPTSWNMRRHGLTEDGCESESPGHLTTR